MMRSPRRSTRVTSMKATGRYQGLIRLWCLRLLVRGGGYRQFLAEGCYMHQELGLICGLPEDDESDVPGQGMHPNQVREILESNLVQTEQHPPSVPQPLARNAQRVARRVGLGEIESALLVFLALAENSEALGEVLEMVLKMWPGQIDSALATALGCRARDVSDCISDQGLLVRSGLVRREYKYLHRRNELNLELLSLMAQQLLRDLPREVDIFRPFFTRAAAPTISAEHMPHLGEELRRITAVLDGALKTRQPGVNILLYGPPGTGKTEFARIIARQLRCKLQEVSDSSSTGEPMAPMDRFRAWRLCQQLEQRQRKTVVLFDEIEDVFDPPIGFFMESSSRRGGKAAVNHALEHNPVPSIWVSNEIGMLNPAYLRRFMVVLEIGPPPRAVRKRIVSRLCRGLSVSPQWQARVAGHEAVTPAQVARVAELARLTRAHLDQAARERFMEAQLNHHLQLQDSRPLPADKPAGLPWRLELLEAGESLQPLLDGLAASGRGSLLLYGPPGTGKTALASALAERLGRPLMVKAASDLLNPFVGMTEKFIAQMFEQAKKEGAVLFLDEADSMLHDRSNARQSWQISQVNEMLARMEQFDGIFVCATNFLRLTDAAALRRFDRKIRLAYPGTERRRALLRHLLRELGVRLPRGQAAGQVWQRLDAMTALAPGDFATVARRHQRLGERLDVTAVLDALEDEMALKPDAPVARIGF